MNTMKDDIIIRGNYLRLLNDVFMQIIPLDERKISRNDRMMIVTEDSGIMGTAECIGVGLHSFLNLHENINNLCDNMSDYRNYWRQQGYLNDSKMQLVYFRFISRDEEVFRKLIARECRRIGLSLEPRPTLFDQK